MNDEREPVAAPGPTTTATTTAATTTTPAVTITTRTARRFYVIEEGDTLDQVALENDTTVERLLVLNPDVDPASLRIGQRIRVR